MLARQIPLFPLPNVVLFPNVFLPLHIFEPRYRRLVADALAGDRMIGIVLLKPGWETEYEGAPAVYPVGCTGLITHAEPLADGRYNIVLRGLEKFRILAEDAGEMYPRARVEVLLEDVGDDDRESVRGQRLRLEALLAPAVEGGALERIEQKIPTAMPDEDLIHALAQYLALEPMERQALLERESVRARGASLIELLEMKELAASPQAWARPKKH